MKFITSPFQMIKKGNIIMKKSIICLILLFSVIQLEADENKETKRAFLGVSTLPVNPALATHLGLDKNHGLIIQQVIKNSAAEKYGMKKYDILTKLNDIIIDGKKSLYNILKSFQPGQEIDLSIIRTGKTEIFKLVLGERQDRKNWWLEFHNKPKILPADQLDLDDQKNNKEIKELEREMQKLHEIMNKLEQGKIEHRLQINERMQKLMENLAKRQNGPNHIQFNGHTQSTIRSSDESHNILIESTNGDIIVKISDKNGNTLFEGPINTEDDKKLIPIELKDKVLNIQGKAKVMIKFNDIEHEK
jgi:serine protease Do